MDCFTKKQIAQPTIFKYFIIKVLKHLTALSSKQCYRLKSKKKKLTHAYSFLFCIKLWKSLEKTKSTSQQEPFNRF